MFLSFILKYLHVLENGKEPKIKKFADELYNLRSDPNICKSLLLVYRNMINKNDHKVFCDENVVFVSVRDDSVILKIKNSEIKEDYSEDILKERYTKDNVGPLMSFIRDSITKNTSDKKNYSLKIDFSGMKNIDDTSILEKEFFLRVELLDAEIIVYEIREEQMFVYNTNYLSGSLDGKLQYFFSYDNKYYCSYFGFGYGKEEDKVSNLTDYLYKRYVPMSKNQDMPMFTIPEDEVQENCSIQLFIDIVEYKGLIEFLEGLFKVENDIYFKANILMSLFDLICNSVKDKNSIIYEYIETLSEKEEKKLLEFFINKQKRYIETSGYCCLNRTQSLLNGRLSSFIENYRSLMQDESTIEQATKIIMYVLTHYKPFIKENRDRILKDIFPFVSNLFDNLSKGLLATIKKRLICSNLLEYDPELKNPKIRALYSDLKEQLVFDTKNENILNFN